MYDIIVVGAGPAGLTAALYAKRGGKSVLVLEAKTYGGQIVGAAKVENYPAIKCISGIEYAKNLYKQVKDLGVEIRFETVQRVTEEKEVVTLNNTYQAKCVILATGVNNRKLQLEGEEDYVGKGISYCATCDGNFFKKKIVAVVGGGNTALSDAVYLSNIAKKVYIIYRRDKFKGEKQYVAELEKKKNIEIIMNSNITKLKGKKVLEAIEITDLDENVREIPVNGLFIAVGQEPNNNMFNNVAELNDYGYFVAKDEVYTKTPGIYVAGDARVKDLRQLVTAVNDGAVAAMCAIREIRKEEAD